MELAEDADQAAKLSSAICNSANVSSGDWGEHMVCKGPSALQQYIGECKSLEIHKLKVCNLAVVGALVRLSLEVENRLLGWSLYAGIRQ